MSRPLRIQYPDCILPRYFPGKRTQICILIDQEYKNPLADIANPVILGNKEFVVEIKERFMGAQKPDRDLPALRKLSSKASIEQNEEAV